ncbi:hypothetical protein PCANC_22664 [Puccinia coronata f. sp. avenae]|uniref:Fungal-type protein kinase domain-containing protein n=1 Tax=Puccinia coronata f. sp. avenae TaxID=200324 RepID=A0A2N5TVM4_9BASI|nr:hypothetical protein PCANC_22664 [Puccinia coronata f. sp. avenae]
MAGISVDIKSHVWRRINFQSCETLKIAEELNGPQVSNEYVNQVHRRLILKDLGKPIHTVDSPVCLLGALEGCIKGHQALLKAGYLHACKPPHAARRPHAYKWREDSRLGVRPRWTGVLAMHACLEGVQALHALRTGVHGWHACPARLT